MMKKILIGLGLTALANIAPLQAQNAPNFLQLYYMFDGNLIDASGNGRDGQIGGTYNYAQAFSFSNTDSCLSSTGDYALYYDYRDDPAPFRTQNYSCMFWVKLDSLPNLYTNFMENSYWDNNSTFFRILNTAGGLRLQGGWFRSSPLLMQEIETPDMPESTLIDGQWHMLGFSSGVSNNLRVNTIYLDGQAIHTGSFSSPTAIAYDPEYTKINIGHRDGLGTFGIDGQINNFAYFSDVITTTDAQNFYNQTIMTVGNREVSPNANDNAANISLFPNPADHTITLNTLPIGASIKITDIAGRLAAPVVISNETATQIDISQLANGIYFVQIEHNQARSSKKLIIQR